MYKFIQYNYTISVWKKQRKSACLYHFFQKENIAHQKYAVSRKKASAFQQMPFSGGDEEDRFSARTARPGHPRSRQSTGLSLCTAPTSIPLSPFCKRTRKKEVPAFLQVLLSGGDEGDRTPYLLNAIQALSRYTRERTPILPLLQPCYNKKIAQHLQSIL